jgi:guanylate kinase
MAEAEPRARLTVLSGPSGVGKGTVVSEVCRRLPDVWLSVSVTTRPPRAGEREGVEYHFVDQAAFDAMAAAGELLEHDAHLSASYGTPRRPVEERLAAGVPVLLEIDLQGARQVRERMPEACLVFIAPPSFDELARRLQGRGTEDPEGVRERLDRARIEMAAEDEFDAVVVNDSVESAADRVVALMITPPNEAGRV